MSINRLILQGLKKNIRNYYLYVFALIFSVGLYFAFVTLQYDPALSDTKDTIKGAAGIRVGSVLLIAIVTVFLLYANTLFIKRRSKEVGLLQLIGMTKGKIFRILTVENIILYFGSMLAGVFLGFAGSKLLMLIYVNITGIQAEAALNFSGTAFLQTVIVFIAIYLLMMLMNFIYIKKQSILSLFRATSKTETTIRRMSILQMIIGIAGIGLVALGYYLSTQLFNGRFENITSLFAVMIAILGSVIIGTYLFFKGSVSFILQLIRKSKAGYLNINDVLSLSSIMFRMKSNALLLTIITTVSALAIGLLSLSYISYYSAEKLAKSDVPNDFSLVNQDLADSFMGKLKENDISYTKTQIDFLDAKADMDSVMESSIDFTDNDTTITVISDASVKDVNLRENEIALTGFSNMFKQFMTLHDKGTITFNVNNKKLDLTYVGLRDQSLLPSLLTGGGLPAAIVNDATYQKLAAHLDPSIQFMDLNQYIGIDIKQNQQLGKANQLFHQLDLDDAEFMNKSQADVLQMQKKATGMTMFIVGFLGLTFLITSGCILYFKQMDESESEKSAYTILRKLGYTQRDLLRGIQRKQLFNFGIPLILGLLHSYFAIKSGWFLFGTEMLTPMIIVMAIYTVLYSIFGILSVLYYKRVIKEAL